MNLSASASSHGFHSDRDTFTAAQWSACALSRCLIKFDVLYVVAVFPPCDNDDLHNLHFAFDESTKLTLKNAHNTLLGDMTQTTVLSLIS